VLITADAAHQMPLGQVATHNSFVAGMAKREGDTRVRVSVFRNDPADDPTPINVDEYLVFERFPSELDVWGMIQAATTDPGPNFQRYRDDHVFLVKEHPGDNHWLMVLPEEVRLLLEANKSGAV